MGVHVDIRAAQGVRGDARRVQQDAKVQLTVRHPRIHWWADGHGCLAEADEKIGLLESEIVDLNKTLIIEGVGETLTDVDYEKFNDFIYNKKLFDFESLLGF